MTKATIIEDAITYIHNLKDKVESLTHELEQMEATSLKTQDDNIDAAQEMKISGIQVNYIYIYMSLLLLATIKLNEIIITNE